METNLSEWEKIAIVGVASGQLLLIDPRYIDAHWKEEEFKDIRQYQNKQTGEMLEYHKDFSNYQQVIAQFGKSMFQLIESGDWIKLEQLMPKGLSYNAVCLATRAAKKGGQVAGFAAAVGMADGNGDYAVMVKRNSEGRIMKVLIEFDEEGEG